MQGIITHIQSMSIHDGPGIRSTIFLKGCNFSCPWCHNPETLSPYPEMERISDKCINCHSCLATCTTGALIQDHGQVVFNRSKCNNCQDCIESCYTGALNPIGKTVTAEDIFDQIQPDFPFFSESGGGITLSGGEPMLQFGFTMNLLELFHSHHIHTALETNLSQGWPKYQAILPFTDLILADLKLMDPDLHKKWTGRSNRNVLHNLQQLDHAGASFRIRTPVIPGVNDQPDQVEAIAQFVSQLNHLEKFELIPYHPLAQVKYGNLQQENIFNDVPALTETDLKKYDHILEKYQLNKN